MDPEQALAEIAEIAERCRPREGQADPELGEEVLKRALRWSRAEAGFLARSVGNGLVAVTALDASGEPIPVPPRQLDRVAQAVRESLAGVRDAPERMTGGQAPRGAVAVKAEAGHPPIHALPLFDSESGAWAGVLGLRPDPKHPEALSSAAQAALLSLSRLLPARAVEEARASEVGQLEATGPAAAPSFKYRYEEIVTRSERMFAVFRRLDRMIGSHPPVLIIGETGTGKELIARALHENDPVRRSKRLYTQNVAALTPTLLESELFGHEKGAFTGADQRKKGLFEVASGSTLFLDEVGEMSLEMQAKLLRVLQEKEVIPLGATEPVKVDVRLVAATHRDLEDMVADKRFREDLYYRLKVLRVHLPPLRERTEDLVLLIDHFLRRQARERGQRPKRLDTRDPRVLATLTRYKWPGNVRELENQVQRMALLTPGDVIGFEALAEDKSLLVDEEEENEGARPVRPLADVVEEAERAEIDNALRFTSGNRTHAADLLQINRRSLLRRLKKYGDGDGEEGAEEPSRSD